MKNEIAIKKVMIRFVVECHKFVSLRERKKVAPLSESEQVIFNNARNVVVAYGVKLKELGVEPKDAAGLMLQALKSANLVTDNPEQRGLTPGQAAYILSQFIDTDNFVRSDSRLKEDSMELVRNSHTLNILSKYAPFYGDHETLINQEIKVDALLDDYSDKYLNPAVVRLALMFASEQFNNEELEEYGQPTDYKYITALVLSEEHPDEKEDASESE